MYMNLVVRRNLGIGLLAMTILLAGSALSKAQQEAKKPTPEEAPKEKASPSPAPEKKGEFQPPPPVVTDHMLTLPGGATLKYKATTGYLLLRDTAEGNKAEAANKEQSGHAEKEEIDPAKGKPKALVFFVAYTLEDGADPSTRPITFAFNGGPGSASLWLHMGALGPRRTVLSDDGEALPPPYKVVDNESTWLDRTDLVFIDPVSTGFSRPAPGVNAAQFHGYKEDIVAVGDFIRLWTSRYGRWAAPKFIVGESYGTTRAAGLSDYLQHRYGLYLNGIVLMSSVLNFQTIDFGSGGNDVPYPLYLPSYTAAAWYHKRLAPEMQQKSLGDVLAESESFSAGEYLVALARGDTLPRSDRERVAGKLAELTGLDAKYLEQQNLREPAMRFFYDLLKDENRSIGRFDSRFTGIRNNPGTDGPDFDPSFAAVSGPFTATFNDYVRHELKYESDLPYETLANVEPWNFSKDEYLNVADDLKKAMNWNPYLRVLVCCGYYDLATPYFAAKQVVQQMHLDSSIRNNIELAYYESGHMVYIHAPSRRKLKSDFEQFLNSTLSAPPVTNAGR
jgi:carboxypeptidase C (cathepsin A)